MWDGTEFWYTPATDQVGIRILKFTVTKDGAAPVTKTVTVTVTPKIQAALTQTSGPPGGDVRCFASTDTSLFAGTYGGGVYRSNDNGLSWTAVNNGLTDSFVLSLAVRGNTLFAGTSEHGVFRSTDNATTWTATNAAWPNLDVYSLAVSLDSSSKCNSG